MIRFLCECGVWLRAPDEKAGWFSRCPKCGLSVSIPLPPTPTPLDDMTAADADRSKIAESIANGTFSGFRRGPGRPTTGPFVGKGRLSGGQTLAKGPDGRTHIVEVKTEGLPPGVSFGVVQSDLAREIFGER